MTDSHDQQALRRARAAFERGDYAAALVDLQRVLEDNPGFADVHHLAGLCFSQLDEPKAALDAFDRAIALNEEYVEAHLHRSITLNELGRYDEGREALERARECEEKEAGRFPTTVSARLANAHAAVGDLYMETGAAEEAVEQYRAAVRLRPGFLDIRNKLARALIQLDDLQGAHEQLVFAVEGNPKYVEGRLNMGLVHFLRGNLDKAAHEWERCGEHAPDHPQLRAYLNRLERARAAADASGGGDGE